MKGVEFLRDGKPLSAFARQAQVRLSHFSNRVAASPAPRQPAVSCLTRSLVNVTGAAVTSLNGTHGSLTGNSLWTSTEIVMKGTTNKVLAQPSGLFGGKAYNVTWKAAQ